jgi:hypothetical protein
MASTLRPRLDILPPAQRRLWDEPAAVLGHFVLYGGTALALHLAIAGRGEGLREAIDNAPPGIVDARSWSYCNAGIGRFPRTANARAHIGLTVARLRWRTPGSAPRRKFGLHAVATLYRELSESGNLRQTARPDQIALGRLRAGNA